MADWIKIKNDYINGNISYRKLAEKHDVCFSAVSKKAAEEKWFEQRTEQRKKIGQKIGQKTAEKIAEQEANRILRISAAADKLLEKIEEATEQLDLYITKSKRRYMQEVIDPKTQEPVGVEIEEEVLSAKQVARIDKAGLKQIASTLKDLREIQFAPQGDKPQESPSININISAATVEDVDEE